MLRLKIDLSGLKPELQSVFAWYQDDLKPKLYSVEKTLFRFSVWGIIYDVAGTFVFGLYYKPYFAANGITVGGGANDTQYPLLALAPIEHTEFIMAVGYGLYAIGFTMILLSLFKSDNKKQTSNPSLENCLTFSSMLFLFFVFSYHPIAQIFGSFLPSHWAPFVVWLIGGVEFILFFGGLAWLIYSQHNESYSETSASSQEIR